MEILDHYDKQGVEAYSEEDVDYNDEDDDLGEGDAHANFINDFYGDEGFEGGEDDMDDFEGQEDEQDEAQANKRQKK